MAFGSLRWLRAWRFAPYFLGLAVFALLMMAIGFPQGKPLERALDWVYYHVPSLQTLRTTYKAAPVLALALGCLGGAGAHLMIRGILRARLPRTRALVLALVLRVLAAIPVLYGLPFFTGVGRTRGSSTTSLLLGAGARRRKPDHADGAAADDHAGAALPLVPLGRHGQLHRPGDLERPVLVRDVLRYADPFASQLLATVDDLVQQGRLVRGQLLPLLRLMGVGQVLVATDGRPDQTGESSPATVAARSATHVRARPCRAVLRAVAAFLPAAGRGGPAPPPRPAPLSASRRGAGHRPAPFAAAAPCSTATPTASPRSRRWVARPGPRAVLRRRSPRRQ